MVQFLETPISSRRRQQSAPSVPGRQVPPPSRVCHRAGPNAHPAPALVNKIVLTAFAGGVPW
jgi:hypothetical protein